MNDVELAYLAGLFDGEGCVTATLRRHDEHRARTPSLALTISVRMVDRDGPAGFAARFGGTVKHSDRQADGWRDVWGWACHGREAADVLRLLLPYLRVKRAQAALVVAHFDDCTWRRGGRRPVPPLEVERRREMVETLGLLNRRGRAEASL